MSAVTEHTLDLVRAAMRQNAPRTPAHYDNVYKEECSFSFETPYSPDGLNINMTTWQSFSKDYLALDSRRSNNLLYLNEKWKKVRKPQEAAATEGVKPQKLAIGVEGGFLMESEMYDVIKSHKLVVLDNDGTIAAEVPLPEPQLPEAINMCIKALIDHESSKPEGTSDVWEEDRKVSRYADNLEQLEEGMGKWGRHIPSDPSQWECDETGVRENLWLNLSTGFIGSGRQNFGGGGGNGAALRHFEATGKKYPLVVKLGTITPQGADVYSYAEDEDDMVLDPHLAQHLAHWGINRMVLLKTEKTMAELQIDLNMAFEFDKITEKGSALQPVYGPGLVGLKNLGNSCYMNSVLQLLYTLPQVQKRYGQAAQKIFETAPVQDICSDFPAQMAKVGLAITQGKGGSEPVPAASAGAAEPLSGETEAMDISAAPQDGPTPIAVKPAAFKARVGRGNVEFSSSRQQDAVEYFQYLLDLITKEESVHKSRLDVGPEAPLTANSFSFKTVDRIECNETRAVSYNTSITTDLGLDIPLEAATNQAELANYREREAKRAKVEGEDASEGLANGGVATKPTNAAADKEEPVLPNVPFLACLSRWAGDELIGYNSAAAGRRTTATKRTRFGTFPPYLFIALQRYFVSADWVPKKMEVLVDVPDTLNLEHLRSGGPQPGEVLQPQDDEGPTPMDATTAAPVDANEAALIAEVVGMGFSENGARRAIAATGASSSEVAIEWVLTHMGDPDFNDPLPAATGQTAQPRPVAPHQLEAVMAMGFTADEATAALMAGEGNVESALDWLFNQGDRDAAVASILSTNSAKETAPGPSPTAEVNDGKGEYTLVGFISHMGSNTQCGHYVAHIKKGDQWVIFNDEKVAISEKPPKDLGYAYLFKRNDA